jgi:hypothetical protein
MFRGLLLLHCVGCICVCQFAPSCIACLVAPHSRSLLHSRVHNGRVKNGMLCAV